MNILPVSIQNNQNFKASIKNNAVMKKVMCAASSEEDLQKLGSIASKMKNAPEKSVFMLKEVTNDFGKTRIMLLRDGIKNVKFKPETVSPFYIDAKTTPNDFYAQTLKNLIEKLSKIYH